MCTCHLLIDSNIYGRNSQHSMLDFHKESIYLLNNRFQGILPTNMLTSLVNINNFVSYLYMDDIYEMICKPQHLHMEQYFIQHKYYIN